MEEKQSGKVPIVMEEVKSDSEVDGTKTLSHAEEARDEDPLAVENPTDISTASVVVEQSGSTEEAVSAIKIPDCDVVIEERISSETVTNRSECEHNTRTEVPMDVEATENQINILFNSPREESPRKQSLSEILSSTPNNATESSSVITNTPGDFHVEGKISDDEDDDIVELSSEQTFKGSHRGTVVPYSDTDDSDSSSSSDSETSSDSSSSDCEDNLNGSDSKNKSICDSKSPDPKPGKARGELNIEDLPPIQDLHISVRNDQAVEIGKVLHAVDTLVVVECYKDQPPLDIDSVLFLDRGARPLGRIFDVMGPVTEPLYCVRFNSKEHIEEQNIQPGMLVFSAPQTEHSQFVFVKHLMMMKGSDASWKKDKEVPGSELDFSDDEEEAQRKRDTINRTEHLPNSWDEPKRKVSRPNPNESDGKFQSNTRGFQGCPRGQTRENFRPRNPWGWSGARFTVPNNNLHQNHHNQFKGRGFGTSQISAPQRNENNRYRNASNTQFGQESAPGMFGNPPPSSSSSYDPSSEYSSYQDYENDYTQENHYASASGNDYSQGQQYSNGQEAYPPHNTPDQRYAAFQSEIAKLVDAYNRGVDSPMTVASATFGMRPPGPRFGGPPGPRPQFGARPFARRPPFAGRPPSAPHQFSATPPPGPWTQFASGPTGPPPLLGPRPARPPPQFGSRPVRPPTLFGSRPTGTPPQFGSRPPAPAYDEQFY